MLISACQEPHKVVISDGDVLNAHISFTDFTWHAANRHRSLSCVLVRVMFVRLRRLWRQYDSIGTQEPMFTHHFLLISFLRPLIHVLQMCG